MDTFWRNYIKSIRLTQQATFSEHGPNPSVSVNEQLSSLFIADEAGTWGLLAFSA